MPESLAIATLRFLAKAITNIGPFMPLLIANSVHSGKIASGTSFFILSNKFFSSGPKKNTGILFFVTCICANLINLFIGQILVLSPAPGDIPI